MSAREQPVCLTIAGLDPSGGAGIVADLKTFAAFGCYGAAAVTSVTFQNTTGVFGAVHQTADSVRRQVEAVLDDLDVAAVKTGMLPTAEIIDTVAELIETRRLTNIVVDPVVRSTSGFDLIDDAALRSLTQRLFRLADMITPNLAEAERIAGFRIVNRTELERAAAVMHEAGAKNVLIKGGHRIGSEKGLARDHLFTQHGQQVFDAEFIDTTSTHGTGCTLASAITAGLARGNSLDESIGAAKRFVTEAIRTAPGLGAGNGPLNHLIRPSSDG